MLGDYALARAQVARGAALLDKHARPGWRQAIDRNRFTVSHGDLCTLGQLAAAGYIPGATTYGEAVDELAPSERGASWSESHGFDGTMQMCALLNDAWREELAK